MYTPTTTAVSSTIYYVCVPCETASGAQTYADTLTNAYVIEGRQS